MSRSSQPDLARHERALDTLDELAGQDVVLALVELGVDLAPGTRIDPADAGRRCRSTAGCWSSC